MSDLVGNPEDWFSRVTARISLLITIPRTNKKASCEHDHKQLSAKYIQNQVLHKSACPDVDAQNTNYMYTTVSTKMSVARVLIRGFAAQLKSESLKHVLSKFGSYEKINFVQTKFVICNSCQGNDSCNE